MNLTKPKTAKIIFDSDVFGSFYDKTVRFCLIYGLYFEIRLNQTKLCYLQPIYVTLKSKSIIEHVYHLSPTFQGNKHQNLKVTNGSKET